MLSGKPWSSWVEIGAYRGVIRVPRGVFQRQAAHPPSDASRRTTSSSTRFECIGERKLRRRQLTEDGNVAISGCD
jgi:hypothetical protein